MKVDDICILAGLGNFKDEGVSQERSYAVKPSSSFKSNGLSTRKNTPWKEAMHIILQDNTLSHSKLLAQWRKLTCKGKYRQYLYVPDQGEKFSKYDAEGTLVKTGELLELLPHLDGMSLKDEPLQKIFYGAPGTGKSFRTDCLVKGHGQKCVRVTFHPDSDYSSFVGTYKPTMKDGKIVYQFIAQAFLKAYVEAWKFPDKPEFLVIEEVNRGNCAQIFGDLFQLLDRDDNGFSKYPIISDDDVRRFLVDDVNGFGKARKTIGVNWPRVARGEELVLPGNFYIWATMNTSDQSLFPIDSAFKRRWDWEYMPIVEGKAEDKVTPLGWQIAMGAEKYDWWDFVKKVNAVVWDKTSSEDKMIGYFFVKAKDGIISMETMVNKVFFYLWNDVFKDSGLDEDVFTLTVGSVKEQIEFRKFFNPDTGMIDEVVVKAFLENLKVRKAGTSVGGTGSTSSETALSSSALAQDSVAADSTTTAS